MNIQISTKNAKLTDDIRALVDDKLKKKLKPHIPKNLEEPKAHLMIEYHKGNDEFKVTFDLHLGGKNNSSYATAKHKNVAAAITEIERETAKQLKKLVHA